MELILICFYLTGALAIFLIAVPFVLLYMAYEITLDFITNHWGALLITTFIASVIIGIIPVRRTENKAFVTLSGNILTAKNYLEFTGGMVFISLWGYVLYSLIAG